MGVGAGAERPAVVRLLGALLLAMQVLSARGFQTFLRAERPPVWCPELSLSALGVDGSGARDAAPRLDALDSQASPEAGGIHFAGPGTYLIRGSLTLAKPVVAQPGAVFQVAAGASLTLRDSLSAGMQRVFAGRGRVRFRGGAMPALRVEWFGALGDGVSDDAPAINAAMQAANESNAEVVFARRRYAVGSTLRKGEGTRVSSQPGATLVALRPGLTGMEYEKGGHVRPDQLPAFEGFRTALRFADVGMTDAFTPLISATPGLPCQVGIEMNADSALIRFGTIRDCATGVWVTTPNPGHTVMQGFSVEGDAWVDSRGVGKQVVLFTAPNPNRPPYWDHDYFRIRKVLPHRDATGFAVVRSKPLLPNWGLPFHVYDIQHLGPLPPSGKLLDTNAWDTVLKLGNLSAPFSDGQLDYSGGDFNMFYFSGPATAVAKPLLLSDKPNSLAAFKQRNGVQHTPFANRLTVELPRGERWRQGETRQFYLYHQLAFEGQCLFLNVPGLGSRCSRDGVAVTALTDNSLNNRDLPEGVKYEIVVSVLACRDLPASRGPIRFDVAVGAPSA